MTTTNKKVHQLVDPTTSAIVPEFTLSPRLDSLTNKKMGLIDDAKTNAKELLEELAEFLKDDFGIEVQKYYQKPSAGKPTDPEVIKKISQECDFVVVAIGS